MAVQPWKVYQDTRRLIGSAGLNLSGTVFRICLVQSASNFATETLSTWGSITSEVAEGNGYSSSGKGFANETWTQGASAQVYRLDADDVVWTATGGAIANIKGAVVWVSGASALARKLLCYASLTSAQFTLAQGNTLTIVINPSGILTLSGA